MISKTRHFLFWFTSLGVALASLRFLVLGVESSFPDTVMIEHISDRRLFFITHVSLAPVALALGLFQFLPGLRARHLAAHRWTGRVYALAVLGGGLSSLVMAAGALDRPMAASGFAVLAILWIALTANAVRLAMAGQIAQHRRWMIRSYALTFAAVTLRLQLPFFAMLGGMDYEAASSYVAWVCWVPNLIIAELYLRRPAKRAVKN